MQFHPEVVHTPRGKEIISNFVHAVCGCGKNWTMRSYIDQAVEQIRAQVEDTTIGWRFVNRLMKERHGVDSMPETAENVAAEFGIARADQDAFALRSHERSAQAWAEMRPAISPLPARKSNPGAKGSSTFSIA